MKVKLELQKCKPLSTDSSSNGSVREWLKLLHILVTMHEMISCILKFGLCRGYPIPNAFNSIPDSTRAITVMSLGKYLNLSLIRILLAWITIFFCCLSSCRLQSLMLEFYCVSTKLYFKPLSPEEKEKEQFQVIRIVQICNPWKSVVSWEFSLEDANLLVPCLRIQTSVWFHVGAFLQAFGSLLVLEITCGNFSDDCRYWSNLHTPQTTHTANLLS
jgi:hypothetical protein